MSAVIADIVLYLCARALVLVSPTGQSEEAIGQSINTCQRPISQDACGIYWFMDNALVIGHGGGTQYLFYATYMFPKLKMFNNNNCVY